MEDDGPNLPICQAGLNLDQHAFTQQIGKDGTSCPEFHPRVIQGIAVETGTQGPGAALDPEAIALQPGWLGAIHPSWQDALGQVVDPLELDPVRNHQIAES